ncbi:MAG: hypothetical protein JRM74_04700 [Nitrososphaerota archaeon]|nr:hypothetical protein [Nitrososphaerota archaeon]
MGEKKTDGYRTIRIQDTIYAEIEKMTEEEDSFYRSVSEFVHESLRIRLQEIRQSRKKT